MDMRAAFDDTLELARGNRMDRIRGRSHRNIDFGHLVDMRSRITDDFSEAKLGRWLGWAQCAVVAAGCGTLEDMKTINMRHSGNTNATTD